MLKYFISAALVATLAASAAAQDVPDITTCDTAAWTHPTNITVIGSFLEMAAAVDNAETITQYAEVIGNLQTHVDEFAAVELPACLEPARESALNGMNGYINALEAGSPGGFLTTEQEMMIYPAMVNFGRASGFLDAVDFFNGMGEEE